MTTITTKVITSNAIKKGYPIDKLKLNDVMHYLGDILKKNDEYSREGPLDFTIFTMKKGIKVIGGAIVQHVEVLRDYYDPDQILIKDLHYVLSDLVILKEYRNDGYQEELLKKITEVIKEPFVALTDYSSVGYFYWLNGGNQLQSLELLYDGVGYYVFNVDVETGKKWTLELADLRGENDEWFRDYEVNKLWDLNSKPHTMSFIDDVDDADDIYVTVADANTDPISHMEKTVNELFIAV